jgi:hypothetical protein
VGGGRRPERAAQAWSALDCRYEAALALAGTTDERLLRDALAAFTDLGADAAVRVTRLKMRRLGFKSIPAGPRPATKGRAVPQGRRGARRAARLHDCSGAGQPRVVINRLGSGQRREIATAKWGALPDPPKRDTS